MTANGEVTRLEIADAVRDAFGPRGADRDGILAGAARNRARPEVIEVLRRLPDRTFREMRGLWEELSDVPVG